jgi:hypothetical protein
MPFFGPVTQSSSGWWFQTFFMFHFNPFHIWDVILPIDELIFFKILHYQPDEYPIVLFDLQTKTGDFLQQTVSLPDGIPFYFP